MAFPDGRTRLLGIVGDPLEHSRSPELHTAVLRELGRNLVYVPVPVSGARLRAFLRLAPELGFVGVNVTTPYKEKVFGLVEAMNEETRCTGTVNTVVFESGCSPRGTSTDGAGMVRWLRSVGAPGPFGVLGFGPTARSVVYRAWAEGLGIEVVVTRRPRVVRGRIAKWGGAGDELRAEADISEVRGQAARGDAQVRKSQSGGRELAARVAKWEAAGGNLPARGPAVVGWNEVEEALLGSVRTWISTLPPSVPIAQPFWDAIDPGAVVLDMNYGEGRAALCAEARRRGHRAADGLGPLLDQAALSLSMWLGEEVPVALFRQVAEVGEEELRR